MWNCHFPIVSPRLRLGPKTETREEINFFPHLYSNLIFKRIKIIFVLIFNMLFIL